MWRFEIPDHPEVEYCEVNGYPFPEEEWEDPWDDGYDESRERELFGD